MDRLSGMSVFVKAVETGSFAATASALNLSSAMVGRYVQGLEESLGVKLLARTTRRQSLTDIGRIYYEHCKLVLAEVDAADASIQSARATPRGLLRINAPVSFGEHRLAPALPDYMARNPEVTVELTLNNRFVDLVEEGFDIAIRIGALADSSLIARPLAPYRLALCAAPAYLAEHGVPTTPDELRHHVCLGFVPGASREPWRFRGAEVSPRGPLFSNSGQALIAAALAGLGIIMQAEIQLSADLAAGRLIALLADAMPSPLPMNLVFPPDRRPTPKLRSFIDFMIERFGRP